MKQPGKYKTPNEFKDEDIWFKWFTKKQFLYMVASAIVSVFIFVTLEKFKLTLIGAIAAVVILFAGFFVPRFNMPEDKYIIGGGIPLEQVLIRILAKKLFQKKKIYVSDFSKERNGD